MNTTADALLALIYEQLKKTHDLLDENRKSLAAYKAYKLEASP